MQSSPYISLLFLSGCETAAAIPDAEDGVHGQRTVAARRDQGQIPVADLHPDLSPPTFVVPPAPLFIVRDGLGGEEPHYPCDEVDPASATEEDMDKCELVCKTVSFREVVES